MTAIPFGKGEVRARSGQRIAILAFGTLLYPALAAAEKLDATVANMRFVKPLDVALVTELARSHDAIVTVEEGCMMGGAGSAVLEALAAAGLAGAGADAGPARRVRRAWRPGQAAGAVRAGRRGHRAVHPQALRRAAGAGAPRRTIDG